MSTELKRLGFVPKYSAAGLEAVTGSATYAKVCDVYASSKERSVLKPGLETIEGYLRTYGEPLAARVSEKAPLVLASCDSKVDAAAAYATQLLATAQGHKSVQTALELKARLSASRAENAAAFTEAREKYFTLIESQIEALKAKGVALSETAVAAVRASVADARAKAAAEAGAALEKVEKAWASFAAAPAVSAALEKAQPKLAAAKAAAVDAATAAAAYLAASPTYQAYVAPRVSAIAAQPRVAAAIERVQTAVAPLVAAF